MEQSYPASLGGDVGVESEVGQSSTLPALSA